MLRTLSVLCLLAAGAAVPVAVVPVAAHAAPGPAATRAPTSTQVTADALPTVQHDGVAWTSVVVGNTVYVGGDFATARPAGAAPGTGEVARSNLLAFDIRTGVLDPSFRVATNGPVYALAASPDRTRLYVGGDFTSLGGRTRSRIGAIDIPANTVDTSFSTVMNTNVRAIVATSVWIYLGGAFTSANGKPRLHLARVSTTGAVSNWAPSADGLVRAMVMAPGGTKVIVGGQFSSLNGLSARGIGALTADAPGASMTWKIASTAFDYGPDAGVMSLSTDGVAVYGTGFKHGATTGNYEGMWAAHPSDGSVKWLEDCHGDTYASYAMGGAVYAVGHAHDCETLGGFPEPPLAYHRAMAFTAAVTGTLLDDTTPNHASHGGDPAPSIINWFPDLKAGSYTGLTQAAWTITGNSQYLVLGGEFPTVNGVAQQGLVRFALRPVAPARMGPVIPSNSVRPTLVQTSSTSVHVKLPGYWDRDGLSIRYDLVRDGTTTVATTTRSQTFWDLPGLGFDDTGLAPHSTHTYRVRGQDADGNVAVDQSATITLA